MAGSGSRTAFGRSGGGSVSGRCGGAGATRTERSNRVSAYRASFQHSVPNVSYVSGARIKLRPIRGVLRIAYRVAKLGRYINHVWGNASHGGGDKPDRGSEHIARATHSPR